MRFVQDGCEDERMSWWPNPKHQKMINRKFEKSTQARNLDNMFCSFERLEIRPRHVLTSPTTALDKLE